MDTNTIIENGIQFVPDDLKTQFENSKFLMNAALNFIYNVETIVNKYQHQGKMRSLFTEKSISQVASIMHESLFDLQNLIIKQYHFEAQVNAFLGRKIHFAWADNKGKIFFANELTAQKFYGAAKKNTSNYKGSVTFSKNLQTEATDLPDFLEKSLQEQIDSRLKSHQELYKEILLRWDDNQKEMRRDGKKRNSYYPWHKDQVYWRSPPLGEENSDETGWAWSSVTNKGHISQGYLDFIINQRMNLIKNDFSIGFFMMHFVNMDRIPGIAKGDIIVRGTNDTIQIAVKSSKFDTASIGPYISLAYQIIQFFNTPSVLTIDKVKSIMENLDKYNQSVVQAGRLEAKERIQEYVKNLTK